MKPAATGRVNLHAPAAGVFTVDKQLIDAINAVDPAVTIATVAQYAAVEKGQMVATVKIIPFAVPARVVDRVVDLCKDREAFAVHPYRALKIGMVQTVLPGIKDTVLDKTVRITEARLQRSGSRIVGERRTPHEAKAVSEAIRSLATDSDMVVVFGASAMSDPGDVVPAAIGAAGGAVLRAGMPVDPGNLIVVGDLSGKPVLGAPGCARSPKENGFDWVLDRLVAGIDVTDSDIASMGVGGLLMEIPTRPQPREAVRPMAKPAVHAVVLGAGQSSRMGGPNKLLALFGGQPLIRRTVERALASHAAGTTVVAGHQADRVSRRTFRPRRKNGREPGLSDGARQFSEGRHCGPAGKCRRRADHSWRHAGRFVRRSRPADRGVHHSRRQIHRAGHAQRQARQSRHPATLGVSGGSEARRRHRRQAHRRTGRAGGDRCRDRRRRQRRCRYAGGVAHRRRRAAGLSVVFHPAITPLWPAAAASYPSPCGEGRTVGPGWGWRRTERNRLYPHPAPLRGSILPARGRASFAAALAGLFLTTAAHALTLSSQKDDLFAYPGILSSEDNGAFTVVDYQEQRDINKRDEVPERRVKAKYVSLGVRRQQQDLMLKTAAGDIRHVAVGKTNGAKFIVVYLHGQGGSRKQGVDDFTFGGNFNRVKNLAANNGGLYLSPDFSDFGDKGAGEVAALISHYLEKSPAAPVIVACGSMGGELCWKLAKDGEVASKLGGLLLLGSLWRRRFPGQRGVQTQGAGVFRPRQQGPGVSRRKAGSVLPFDP